MMHQVSKTSRNNLLLGFLMGAVFLSSFLIIHFSLAADDNANENRCVNYVADCDNNQTSCSYFNFNWTTDGYPGGAGNASCCGDDSQEVYVDTTSVGPNLNSDWQDKIGIDPGCCTNYNRCVVGGECYSQGSVINSGWTTGNDIYAYCGEPASGGISGTVYDCDHPGENGYCGDSVCGAGSSTTGPTVYAGEANVGEYPDTSTPGCCGDDSQEFIPSNNVSSDLNYDTWTAKVTPVCCSTYEATCGVDYQCYRHGPILGEAMEGALDMYVLCGEPSISGVSATLYDCDTGDGVNSCGASVCGAINSATGAGNVLAGATGFGEYTNTSTPACCGDDAGENYITTDCDGNSISLCCPDDKRYVQNGVCVASCGCGDNSYDGTDYDDSQSHCDSVDDFHYDLNNCNKAKTAWGLSGGALGNCWQNKCCGDDTGEYNITFNSYTQTACLTDQLSGCCDDSTDCYDLSGNCIDTHNGSDSLKMACEDTVWQNCDNYYADCGASICGSASGVLAGETGVGEYSDITTLGCCGDDSGEYYAELCPGVTSVDRKCCNDSGDKIDQNGNCVSSCPAVNQPPNISLNSPNDGATCQAQSGLRLSWTADDPDSGPNPLQYYVYHSTDQSLVTNHDASVLVATVTSNYYDISGLNYNTTYYWTVIADDGSSQTASEIWSYTTQACDSSQPCCQADGCNFIGDGGQPRGYTDSYSCSGDTACGGSCDIQGTDYYCQDNDSSLHQSSGATDVTCDTCEEWDGSDGCNLCSGNECGLNYDCSTSQCDLYDPDGSGPVAQQAYYQTREEDCNSCQCSAWSAYASCQDSYNNCTSNRVECYQGTGCNTANNACYCETGYNPDGSGGCVSDGTYPIVDFNWCLSAESNTVQFTSSVSGGTEPYTSYVWDFGDSSCPAGADCSQSDPLHTYPTSGVYDVTLVVTDSNSLQGQKTEQVDLNATDKNCSTPFNLNSVTAQSSGSLVLNWDYSLGNSTYAIYRADNGSSNYVQLSNPSYSCDINSCTYTDTGLQPGTQYSYYVLAINSNTYNSTVNPACDGATASPPAHCSLSAYTKSDVGGLDVYSDDCGVIKIKWNDLGEDYTYHLYRNLSGPQNMSSSDMLGNIDRTHCSGGSCLYEDHSIIPEKVYYYKVTSDSTATGESSLDDAASGSAFSYCYRAPVWGEK